MGLDSLYKEGETMSDYGKCVTHHICECLQKKLDSTEADCDALKEQCEKLADALEFYGHKAFYIFDEPDSDTDVDTQKTWRHYSGKLARQALSEYQEFKKGRGE